ncbi:hypothetical protein K7432_010344 [Basidiobolus ranarum]|uniref:C3H1-type domain-containing protein n=1 Tax=Basidiobolus ranarum TaxID=34480 RepID=A0ABR2VVS3_9FUNG
MSANSLSCEASLTWTNHKCEWTTVKERKHQGSPHKDSAPGKKEGRRINKMIVLYKTELCRSFGETATCRYGTKCQFAHGEHELRPVSRHPKYKTLLCKAFWEQGSCPYGQRCCFVHISSNSSDTDPSESNFSDAESLESFSCSEYLSTPTTDSMNVWWINSNDTIFDSPSLHCSPTFSKSNEFQWTSPAGPEDRISTYSRACRLPIFQKLCEHS